MTRIEDASGTDTLKALTHETFSQFFDSIYYERQINTSIPQNVFPESAKNASLDKGKPNFERTKFHILDRRVY